MSGRGHERYFWGPCSVHFLDLGVGLGVCSICENSSSDTVMVNALFCSLPKCVCTHIYISIKGNGTKTKMDIL